MATHSRHGSRSVEQREPTESGHRLLISKLFPSEHLWWGGGTGPSVQTLGMEGQFSLWPPFSPPRALSYL